MLTCKRQINRLINDNTWVIKKQKWQLAKQACDQPGGRPKRTVYLQQN